MKQDTTKLSQIWDTKEKFYPRFKDEESIFQKDLIDITKKWGINYLNKEILEIGCGTGAYTFLLARIAKSVDALDFSKQMLAVLKKDALKLGLSDKITCINDDFLSFKSKKIYDIAFGAMTPALANNDSFLKFNKIAKSKIWLGWAGKRSSKIMDKVFQAHNHKLRINNTSNLLKQWLGDNNIKHKSMPLETTWESRLSFEDMVDDQAWHLKMHKISPNREIIKRALEEFIDKDNKILNKTDVKLEVVVW
ncbi:SAM-dependent methyltransferase [Campylobacter blaseri]|nr:class I SAM-dependent methyltransferase [Campylobacter blaseri]QKF85340.1 SAM-dependent methyltransferase [Campylobacter blaseri]